MRIYRGTFDCDRCRVEVQEGEGGYALPCRTDLLPTSSGRYSWGRAGEETDLLAVSLLADLTRYDHLAVMMGPVALSPIFAECRDSGDFVVSEDFLLDWLLAYWNCAAKKLRRAREEEKALRRCPGSSRTERN